MFKKVILLIIIFFSLFSFVFAININSPANPGYNGSAGSDYNNGNYTNSEVKSIQKKLNNNNSNLRVDGKIGKNTRAAMKKNANLTDISKPEFEINVSNISPGGNNIDKSGGAKQTAKNVLQTIIDNLMIAFGVLTLLVMTIGGGYMIMYHGQDELLSKGKAIFSAGLIAMIVALSAGILVKLVAYLIY